MAYSIRHRKGVLAQMGGIRVHKAKSDQIKALNTKLNDLIAEYMAENDRTELTKDDVKWFVNRHFDLINTINKLEAPA